MSEWMDLEWDPLPPTPTPDEMADLVDCAEQDLLDDEYVTNGPVVQSGVEAS